MVLQGFSSDSFIPRSIAIKMVENMAYRRLRVNEDRISKLPDHLLVSILSLLPMKEASRASILSKRWRYLFTSLPHLLLDHRLFPKTYSFGFDFGKKIQKWVSIIDHILSHHQLDSIQSCEITYFYLDEWDSDIDRFLISFNEFQSDIDRFLSFLTMKGIRRLFLKNPFSNTYKTPHSIFCCGSLLELELQNCILNCISTFEGLRQLESLKLFGVEVSEGLLAELVSSCNLLKKLELWYCPIKNLEIEIRNLLRLFIWSDRPLIIRQKIAISNCNNHEEVKALRYVVNVSNPRMFHHIGVGHFMISILSQIMEFYAF
ncbi:F-box/FBD/LRR-repeat protein At3g26920-like [Tasmannia lanceolata]|uniref:F-box/FBD/LRR-repeat protein At3g26920-like n=1 Tax=Tasmannia lanceolata TaxID=3420 RepID=UPI0040642419